MILKVYRNSISKFWFDFADAPLPLNVILAISQSVFVNGDHTNSDIEPSFGVEATELYAEVKYTSVDEYEITGFAFGVCV